MLFPRHTPRLAAACSAAAVLGLALPAGAQDYDFDEVCAPRVRVETKISAPKVLMILDRSGSMNDGLAGVSKLGVAKLAINEVAASSHRSGPCTEADDSGCDEIELGLGWFAGGSAVNVVPAEDNKNPIATTLAGWNADGGTNTGLAARRIFESAELAEADSAGVGVIITDGGPSSTGTIEDAVYYACEARNRSAGAVPTYMVGLGFGTDARMNAFMAAAGGTGQCCQGSSCTYQETELVDPCDLYTAGDRSSVDIGPMVNNRNLRSGYNCEGSIEATSAQAFKDALVAIAGEAACSFPLTIPENYPAGEGADEDPYATLVVMDHDILGPDLEIQPYTAAEPNAFYNYLITQRGLTATEAAPYQGEGWIFADGTRRTVRLTDKLCEEVRNNEVDYTETQVACLCFNTGLDCQVPCDDPANPGAACEPCEEGEFDLPCVGDVDPGDLVQVGRCNQGIVECVVGQEYCVSRFTIQPDICNGLDDNCDGMIDNLSSADPVNASTSDPNDDPNIAGSDLMSTLTDDEEGLFCNFEDSCGCPGGVPAQNGTPPTAFQDEFALLKDASGQVINGTFVPQCTCGEGLAPAASHATAEGPSHDPYDGTAAACSSTSQTGGAGGASLLGLLGLMLLGARRRRD
jgi:MYXO-CTERM domain-containing protein